MENLPENENLELSAENQDTPEESTIFSDPAEHSYKNRGKKRKPWFTITAAVLAAAILIGTTVAIIKLIPKKENGSSDNNLLDNSISVLEKDTNSLKTVKVENKNGTLLFYSKKSTSNDTETVNWYLDGYDKELISTTATESIVGSASLISASQEITKMTVSDCGLDTPEITVTVVENGGRTYKILIGDTSFDGANCYLKLENKDNIYLCDISLKESFELKPLDFATTASLSGMPITDEIAEYVSDEGAIFTFDTISVTGKNIEDKIILTPTTSTDNEIMLSLYPYSVASPTQRYAETTSVDSIFSLFKNGLGGIVGAYSFDVSDASLKQFGLDSPDFKATISMGGKTLTYSFSIIGEENGTTYCAVINDYSKLISKVALSNVAFVEYRLSDLYTPYVCMINIKSLSAFTVSSKDASYKFELTPNDEDSFDVTLNGNKIDYDKYFNPLYTKVVTISCSDFTVTPVTGEPEFTFTFDFNEENGGGKTVVKFYKISETRYQYVTDGLNLGKVNSNSVRKVIELISGIPMPLN